MSLTKTLADVNATLAIAEKARKEVREVKLKLFDINRQPTQPPAVEPAAPEAPQPPSPQIGALHAIALQLGTLNVELRNLKEDLASLNSKL